VSTLLFFAKDLRMRASRSWGITISFPLEYQGQIFEQISEQISDHEGFLGRAPGVNISCKISCADLPRSLAMATMVNVKKPAVMRTSINLVQESPIGLSIK
jgi:hypothetical protein